jgi:hypothetical protein
MFNTSLMNAGDRTSGLASFDDIEGLRKAIESGYETNLPDLTGAGAVRMQSIDPVLQSVITANQNFVLFNRLPKPSAIATIDEWMELNSIGGFPGGTFNSELGNIAAGQGNYQRRVGRVAYQMTRCEISLVAMTQSSHIALKAQENANGTFRLLEDSEIGCFEGDSTVVPEQFDGIYKQLVDLGSADHIIDAEGHPLTSVEPIAQAAAVIAGRGNYGRPTDLLVSPIVGADMDTNFDPAMRVALNNGQPAQRGTPMRGIVTAQGDVALSRDIYIRDENYQTPFEVTYPALATANTYAPQAVSGATASDASSKFGATHAGNYYYLVTGINKNGESIGTKSAQIAVAAGDKVTLSITASVTGTETGYVIYRSRKNGTNATTDFRCMGKVAKAAGGTTTYADLNREIPGTSKAFLLNLDSAATAIVWRQMLPLSEFALYPTSQAVVPWAILHMGYLRISKRRHHVVIKNIGPSNAAWKPFA